MTSSGTAGTKSWIFLQPKQHDFHRCNGFDRNNNRCASWCCRRFGDDCGIYNHKSTTALTVLGGSGNDFLTSGLLATGVTQTLNGGAGNDTLTAGQINNR